MDATTIKHTCNPDRPGMPLPFGRKAPAGECQRCDELRDGAEPRTLNWVERKRKTEEQERIDRESMARNRAAGLCICGKPKDHAIVCTAFDW